MQPTLAPQITTTGSAITHQPKGNLTRKKISFSTVCAQYKVLLRQNGGRTDASDGYMLTLCQRHAKSLYERNLEVYNIKKGAQPYSVACKALNDIWDISLIYQPELGGLCVCLWQGAIMAFQLPVFSKDQIENEAAFVDWFCYFGQLKVEDNFRIIKNQNGKKNDFELNPVRDYFHTLLTIGL